jgi:O-antigen/teichoic acid export membrane protein
VIHPPSPAERDTAGADVPAVARGGLLNLLGAGVAAVAGVLLVVVVSRTLPQDKAGTFFTLTSLFLLAEMVTRLGTGTGLVYFVARQRSLGRPDLVRAFRRVALVPVLVAGGVTAGVLAFSAPWLAELAGGDLDGVRPAVLLLAVLLPVAALSDTLLTASRGYSSMRPTVVLDRVLRPVLQVALVAAAAGGPLVVLAGAWAAPWVASAVLAWCWLARLDRLHLPPAATPPTRGDWRAFWRFTGPRAVTSVVQVALQRLDIVLVAALIGPAPAAVYTAATRFLVVGQLSGTAITTAAQPRLAGLLAVGARSATRSIYQSATAWLVLLTWPVYLLSAVFADVVLSIFGSGYQSGRPVVVVLAVAMLLATACGMVDTLLNMAGRTMWTLANSVAALVTMVAVDLLLIPRIGILGAAVGWAAAILVNNLLPLAQLIGSLRLHPFGRATLSAALLALLCFGAAPAAARTLFTDEPVAVAAVVLLGAAAYAAAVLRWPRALALPRLRTLRGGAAPSSVPAPNDRTPVGGIL